MTIGIEAIISNSRGPASLAELYSKVDTPGASSERHETFSDKGVNLSGSPADRSRSATRSAARQTSSRLVALPNQRKGVPKMMKHALILSASLAFGLVSAVAHANDPASPSIEAADGSYEVAGLAWRCGRNNPAEWGTFGNGCLKQKRAAKKGRRLDRHGQFRDRTAGSAPAAAASHAVELQAIETIGPSGCPVGRSVVISPRKRNGRPALPPFPHDVFSPA